MLGLLRPQVRITMARYGFVGRQAAILGVKNCGYVRRAIFTPFLVQIIVLSIMLHDVLAQFMFCMPSFEHSVLFLLLFSTL